MLQTVSKKWRGYVDPPHQWGYNVAATAARVEGTGKP
jgi:hypothetical protein